MVEVIISTEVTPNAGNVVVHGLYECRHQAAAALDDAVKAFIESKGQYGAPRDKVTIAKGHCNWEALANGQHFALIPNSNESSSSSSGFAANERVIEVWEKFGKPGRLYGETPRKRLVRVFHCVSFDGCVVPAPPPRVIIQHKNVTSTSSAASKHVAFSTVLVELQEKLKERADKQTRVIPKTPVPPPKKRKLLPPSPASIPSSPESHTFEEEEQGAFSPSRVGAPGWRMMMNPLFFPAGPRQSIRSMKRDETRREAEQVVAAIMAQMDDEVERSGDEFSFSNDESNSNANSLDNEISSAHTAEHEPVAQSTVERTISEDEESLPDLESISDESSSSYYETDEEEHSEVSQDDDEDVEEEEASSEYYSSSVSDYVDDEEVQENEEEVQENEEEEAEEQMDYFRFHQSMSWPPMQSILLTPLLSDYDDAQEYSYQHDDFLSNTQTDLECYKSIVDHWREQIQKRDVDQRVDDFGLAFKW